MKKIFTILNNIPHFRRYVFVFVVSILIAQGVAIQAIPLVEREIVTLIELAQNGESIDLNQFRLLFGITALVAVVYSALHRISYHVANILREEIWNKTFQVGFDKLIHHDLTYLTQDRSSTVLNQVQRAASRFSQLFSESAGALFRNLIKAMVSLAIMLSLNWQIGVVVLLTVLVYTVIYTYRFIRDIPLAEARDDYADKEYSRVWEVIPQASLTKLFTNEMREVKHIGRIGKALLKNSIDRENLWNYAAIAEVFFVRLPTVGVKYYAAYQALLGVISLPNFILLYALIGAVQEPMWVVSWFMWEMQDTYNRGKKYLKILESEVTVKDPEKPVRLSSPTKAIRFEQVDFSYPDGAQHVLKRLSLTFEGKQMSALVGKSGAGKTTITALLARFYDPTSGAIFIGDTNIQDVRLKDLREQIGFVMQESYVFSGTIADNLRYAKEKATRKEIIESLKKAQAWEFIKDFKDGIDTEIGERGIKLSGGQRQRVSIARVILKDPAIVVLDEATNALDSESEAMVHEALESFLKHRTVISIAHRLSTIDQADSIIVLEKGRVSEQGSHAELLAFGGTYRMLHDIQASGFSEQMRVVQAYELA